MGASRSDPRNRFQWLHDVQVGMGQLGPPYWLADYWAGHLFHVQPASQPREQRPTAIRRRWQWPGKGTQGQVSVVFGPKSASPHVETHLQVKYFFRLRTHETLSHDLKGDLEPPVLAGRRLHGI